MNMHWVTARVNLAGQNFYLHDIRESDPISWPEAQVLMALHGEENVYEIKPCAVSDASPTGEKNRLLSKYDAKRVDEVFPGRTPRMEMTVPGYPEDQRRVDNEGHPITGAASVPVGNGDDEDEEEDVSATGREMPTGPAVFKPRETQRGA